MPHRVPDNGHPVSVNTFTDGHLTASQSNPLHTWTAGKCCLTYFPLPVTVPASLDELLLLRTVWFWQDRWVVCCSVACLPSHPTLPFPCPSLYCTREGADPIGPQSQTPMSAGFWQVQPVGGIGKRLEGEKSKYLSPCIEREMVSDSYTAAAFPPCLRVSSHCTDPPWFQLPLDDSCSTTASLYPFNLGLAVAW